MLSHEVIYKLAVEAGAKLSSHKQFGKDQKIVIADNGCSGDGTFFVDHFAFLIEKHIKDNA